MRSFAAYGSSAFCDRLNVALQELDNVLRVANGAGLASNWTVSSAQTIYDDRSNFAVYVNFLGDSCEKDATEVASAAERVRKFLKEQGIDAPSLRPDYVPPEEGLSGWMKAAGFVAAGTVALVALAYATGQVASVARLWKPKRTNGYRRRSR